MQRLLVMTLIGEDRPGLVESIAGVVAENGGNWLESRMSRLGGQFAGILRVAIPLAHEATLSQALEKLSGRGLRVIVHPDRIEQEPKPIRLSRLEIVGQDRPGIVRQISHVLASQGVNVEELETECASAPMSGETLFKAKAKLGLPETCDAVELRKHLERLAADMIVEIAFAEIPQPTAI